MEKQTLDEKLDAVLKEVQENPGEIVWLDGLPIVETVSNINDIKKLMS